LLGKGTCWKGDRRRRTGRGEGQWRESFFVLSLLEEILLLVFVFFGTFLSFIFSAKVRQQPEMGGREGYVQRRNERGVTEKGDAGRGTESEGPM